VQPARRSLAEGCDDGWQRQLDQQRCRSCITAASLPGRNELALASQRYVQPGRLGSVEKNNVTRLLKVHHSVKDEPAWRGIEVDDEALATLERANPEGAPL